MPEPAAHLTPCPRCGYPLPERARRESQPCPECGSRPGLLLRRRIPAIVLVAPTLLVALFPPLLVIAEAPLRFSDVGNLLVLYALSLIAAAVIWPLLCKALSRESNFRVSGITLALAISINIGLSLAGALAMFVTLLAHSNV